SQGKLLLTSLVYDVNDNSPVFDQLSYEVIILESEPVNSMFFKVEATDKDSGLNGEIMYDIAGGNIRDQNFELNAITGELTSTLQLDRELLMRQRGASVFSFVVMSSDQGLPKPLRDQAKVILDENDNAPSFPKSSVSVDILENMRIGELVASVTASDLDSGPNADITYSITATNNHGTFSISPNTGSIFLVKKLDYETQSFYKLNITAKDNGRPPPSVCSLDVSCRATNSVQT
uniref:Cadherin domain-containing protein n=1 Tax=Neogobius melanostomus TaxID=47308 RepID=A0A8C6SG81_9GOBI